jgi:hypothetical protein
MSLLESPCRYSTTHVVTTWESTQLGNDTSGTEERCKGAQHQPVYIIDLKKAFMSSYIQLGILKPRVRIEIHSVARQRATLSKWQQERANIMTDVAPLVPGLTEMFQKHCDTFNG